jgi:CheY-like chemotaxis protein
MPDATPDLSKKLLIVDDVPMIRMSIFEMLCETGYSARYAEDGFTALAEIRKEIPDILLSDLNMPGMSGYELLSVVRRQFSSIQMIAMSGSYSGTSVPPGVIADAFYQKGSSAGSLLNIIENLSHPSRVYSTPQVALAPVAFHPFGHDALDSPYMTIAYSKCLPALSQVLGTAQRDCQEELQILPGHKPRCDYPQKCQDFGSRN